MTGDVRSIYAMDSLNSLSISASDCGGDCGGDGDCRGSCGGSGDSSTIVNNSNNNNENNNNNNNSNDIDNRTIAVPDKIIVSFKATGSAPVLKVSKFRVKREGTTFDYITSFLRRQLSGGYGKSAAVATTPPSLFLYLNSSFSPRPDETLENLYRCFATSDGQLLISYSLVEAWG